MTCHFLHLALVFVQQSKRKDFKCQNHLEYKLHQFIIGVRKSIYEKLEKQVTWTYWETAITISQFRPFPIIVIAVSGEGWRKSHIKVDYTHSSSALPLIFASKIFILWFFVLFLFFSVGCSNCFHSFLLHLFFVVVGLILVLILFQLWKNG